MKKPTLIIVVGLPGTGKTTFARALASEIESKHLNSDIVRNSLGKRGQYDVTSKAAVYNEMLNRTEEALSRRQSIIVDATFYKEILREPYVKLAEKYDLHAKWIELRASDETVKERVGKKRTFSEADFEVYRKIKEDFEPLDMGHLILWTDQIPLDEMVEKAKEFLVIDYTPT